MATLVIFAIVVAAIAVFDVLACRYGVDSRVDSLDPRYPARAAAIN
jgi:hypothetical protein